MSGAVLIRWSGLVLGVGGVALSGFLLGQLSLQGFFGPALQAFDKAYAWPHAAHAASALLTLFGLVGLYARQLSKTGWLGLVAFVIAFIGTVLYCFAGLSAELIVPALQRAAPQLAGPRGAVGSILGTLSVWASVSCALGYLLFALATMRARVLPFWSGPVLVIGGLTFGVQQANIQLGFSLPGDYGQLIGALALAAGFIWLGLALWREREVPSPAI